MKKKDYIYKIYPNSKMAIKDISKNIKGSESCAQRNGTGKYMFEPTKTIIICDSCNTQEEIANYWCNIESYIAKNITK